MSDTPDSQLTEERKPTFDRRRALVSFGGGFAGWIAWGLIVVVPFCVYLRPSSQHWALELFVWFGLLFLLSLFVATGKYLANKAFAREEKHTAK